MENGEVSYTDDKYSIEEFYNNYLAPYIKTVKTEKSYDYNILVYFPNGSAMSISNIDGTHSVHINYYPNPIKKGTTVYGKNAFRFLFRTINYPTPEVLLFPYGIQPYSWYSPSAGTNWTGLTDKEIDDILMNNSSFGCKGGDGQFCTAIIMRKGWKIPKDYPIKL